jgi:hypothetical protein
VHARRFDIRQRRGEVIEHQRHVAGEEIDHRGRRTFVRDMRHVDAGHALEQFSGEMSGAAGAAGCKIELAGVRFRKRDELFDVTRRH